MTAFGVYVGTPFVPGQKAPAGDWLRVTMAVFTWSLRWPCGAELKAAGRPWQAAVIGSRPQRGIGFAVAGCWVIFFALKGKVGLRV